MRDRSKPAQAQQNTQLNQQQQQQQAQQNHQVQHSLLQHDSDVSFVSKLFNPDAEWDRDQLGDVLHWIRQVLGLFCGIVWGLIPLTGSIWLILFMALSSVIIYAYYSYVLKIDEEEFGGHGPLLQEGFVASVTLFLLAWILVYSLLQF